MNAPEINADKLREAKREEERITFLRQCATQNTATLQRRLAEKMTSGPARLLSAVESRVEGAAELVRDWPALWDAIEASRKR